MVGLLTVSSGGLVAEGLSDTVVGVSEEAVVEGPSLGGAVVVGTVVGCVGAGGHRADKLRLGLLSGRERVCMTPLLAARHHSGVEERGHELRLETCHSEQHVYKVSPHSICN